MGDPHAGAMLVALVAGTTNPHGVAGDAPQQRGALAITPNHLGALEYLGETYLQRGDLAKAREQLAKLKSLCPSGCREYDDLQKAVREFESARKKP